MTRAVTLRSVRADWLRVQSEVAWVGMLLAGQRYFEALSREQKFNPNHDALGRFTTGDGVENGGSGQDTLLGDPANDQFTQAGDPQRYSVNLVEEDLRGGHANRDHVKKTDPQLIDIVEKSTIRGLFVTVVKDAQGSFLSLEAANDFTNRVLQKNQTRVDAVASGATDEAWLPERFGYPTGKEAFHASADEPVYIRPTYYVGVLIRHDATSPRGYRAIPRIHSTSGQIRWK